MTRVVDCWLSFFSERALFYRLHKGSLDDIQMAVVVQRMVDATKAGVMFTVDPVTGRRDRIVVEAAYGVEWAFDDTGLYLLQSRPVTTI